MHEVYFFIPTRRLRRFPIDFNTRKDLRIKILYIECAMTFVMCYVFTYFTKIFKSSTSLRKNQADKKILLLFNVPPLLQRQNLHSNICKSNAALANNQVERTKCAVLRHDGGTLNALTIICICFHTSSWKAFNRIAIHREKL